jgi:hypothetical protein
MFTLLQDYEVVGSRGMLALSWIMLKDDTERDNTKRRGRIIEEQRHGKMKMQSMCTDGEVPV